MEFSQIAILFLGVFSAVMCTATSLELSFHRGICALVMFLSAILFYFFFIVLETFHRGKLYGILGITLFVFIVMMRFLSAVKKGSVAIINGFLKGFMNYTDSKLSLLSYTDKEEASVMFCTTFVLILLGVYVTSLISAFFYRRRHSMIYVVLTVPFVLLPLLVGRLGYFSNMFTYLVVTISIVGTRHFRTDTTDRHMRQKLSIILVIVGLVAGGAVWIFMPPKRYEKYTGRITQVKNSVIALTTWSSDEVFSWVKNYFNEDTMDYGKIGKKANITYSGDTVLKISGGINWNHGLYLKGYVGDKYAKNKWRSLHTNEAYQSDLAVLEKLGISPDNWHVKMRSELGSRQKSNLAELWNMGTLRIRNVGFGYGNYVVPYLPASAFRSENNGRTTIDTLGIDYTVSYYTVYPYVLRKGILEQNYEIAPSTFWAETEPERKQMASFVRKYYLDVPKSLNSVCDDFKAYLNENGGLYDKYQKGAVDMGEILSQTKLYISRDTEYSLSPGKTPAGKDTVEYFLKEGKKGYCSYYATTAAMLLRSVGIPTRYVEGMYVTREELIAAGEEGKELEVPDRDAHAWIEVFDNRYGFVVVEVTPGVGDDDVWVKEDSTEKKDTDEPDDKSDKSDKSDKTEERPEKATPTPSVTQKPEEDMTFDDIEKNSASPEEGREGGGRLPISKRKKALMIGLEILIILILIAAAFEIQRRIRRMMFERSLRDIRTRRRIRRVYFHLMPVYIHRGALYRGQAMADYAEQLSAAMRMPEAEIRTYVELVYHARFGPDDITEEQMEEFLLIYEKIRAKAYADAKIFRKLYYMFITAL